MNCRKSLSYLLFISMISSSASSYAAILDKESKDNNYNESKERSNFIISEVYPDHSVGRRGCSKRSKGAAAGATGVTTVATGILLFLTLKAGSSTKSTSLRPGNFSTSPENSSLVNNCSVLPSSYFHSFLNEMNYSVPVIRNLYDSDHLLREEEKPDFLNWALSGGVAENRKERREIKEFQETGWKNMTLESQERIYLYIYFGQEGSKLERLKILREGLKDKSGAELEREIKTHAVVSSFFWFTRHLDGKKRFEIVEQYYKGLGEEGEFIRLIGREYLHAKGEFSSITGSPETVQDHIQSGYQRTDPNDNLMRIFMDHVSLECRIKIMSQESFSEGFPVILAYKKYLVKKNATDYSSYVTNSTAVNSTILFEETTVYSQGTSSLTSSSIVSNKPPVVNYSRTTQKNRRNKKSIFHQSNPHTKQLKQPSKAMGKR